jgi:serine/threonine protein kinase
VPSRIGKFRILRHLKSGGMAAVYQAEDTESGRVVALKVLNPESAVQNKRLERFKRECRQGARLKHENIVRLYEYGEIEGKHYLSMEYVDGVDIEEIVRQYGVLSAADTRSIIAQVAQALDYAEAMKVVHRDIKPSNIIVTRKHGRCIAKLADLGLARGGIEEESRVTADGSTVGTVDYMAPEQAKDSGSADVRSDIYALGCTVYHMLSGAPPFAEGSIIERLMKHAKAEPTDLRTLNPKVPDDLWAICRRMLAKKQSQRYQTAAELLTDLAHAAPDAAASASRPTKVGHLTKVGASTPPASDGAQQEMSLAERLSFSDEPVGATAGSDDGRRIVEGQFQHATHAIASGNYDYGMMLLLNCCRLEPGNLQFHEALYQGQHARAGARHLRAWRMLPAQLALKAWLKISQWRRQPLSVLACARQLLTCNPDDLATQLDMARAARDAGFTDLAAWLFETALTHHPGNMRIKRSLADVLEEQGENVRALELWEAVAAADPLDGDAGRKVRDLAASVATGKFYAARKSRRSRGGSLTG